MAASWQGYAPAEATDEPLVLDGGELTVEQVVQVARFRRRVRLGDEARKRVVRCRAVVEELLRRGEKVYGLTTGFGRLRDVSIDVDKAELLQKNLIRSHAAGVGTPFAEDVVRAAVLLRAVTLCRGHSGVRPAVIEALLALLNDDIYPHIPEQGSVGCSGDLAPLSHLALVVIGDPDGRVYRRSPSSGGAYVSDPRDSDFVRLGDLREPFPTFRPITLGGKEGLALNNGTPVMTAVLCLGLYDSYFVLRASEVAGALSLEASQGILAAFDPRLHAARNLAFQGQVAARLLTLTEGSEILGSPFISAWCGTARDRLGVALAEHAALVAAFVSRGETEPWAVRQMGEHIQRLHDSLGTAIQDFRPPAPGPNDTPATRLAAARRHITPLRREATSLLYEVQSATFPQEESRARLEEALNEAVAALGNLVPAAPEVQDDYSLRCMPQVLGSAWRALAHAHEVVSVEIAAATDNPLIFPPEQEDLTTANLSDCVVSGGNFHGEPIATVADYVAIAMAEVGSISERRVAHLVDRHLSRGLPAFLMRSDGLNSGFMIPQYTAAALVSENKVLCHPASVDSIPTCANSEDHNSMGTIAARKAVQVVRNVRRVVSIELLAAFQAVAFRAPLAPGARLERVRAFLADQDVQVLTRDTVMAEEMNRADALLGSQEFLRLIEAL